MLITPRVKGLNKTAVRGLLGSGRPTVTGF